MIFKSFNLTSFLFAMSTAFILAACNPNEFQSQILNINKKVNLQMRSYEAADVLVRQANNTITLDTPLIVGTLSDINRFEHSTALGRVIPEQVGTRLSQLGYNVQEVKLRKSINVNNDPSTAGEFLTSRDPQDISSQQQAGAVISGTYAMANHNVLVNLRVIDTQTRRVLAAYDYTMPVNADIRALSSPEGGKGTFFEGKQ